MENATNEQVIQPNTATPADAMKATRKRWIGAMLGGFALIGIAYATYWAVHLRYLESTDDAYVGGNVVQITPQIPGTVVAITADDTTFVKAGQPLVQLDRADAEVALEQAEAQLGKAVREVRSLFATSGRLQASVEVQQSDLAKANEDLARRERLASSGAISKEEVQHARDAVRSAQSALTAARQELAANRARVDHTTVENHPEVKNAAAHVHDAYLTYARTAMPAPVSGYVAKRTVQLGQRVTPGLPLMAVVPLDQVWIDANFKEAQLASMRVGQPVKVTADLYGGKIEYQGRIAGFGAGTGSAFALLPAQNATGNWIKIVQRVPVRIALDPKQLEDHPLQIGLSMQVEVDTHEREGARLPQVARAAGYSTDVFRALEDQADDRVKAVIAANEGKSVSLGAAGAADEAGGRPRRVAHLDQQAPSAIAR
jgi:membrane fusion protein (multidrug efflux system)